jgi:hypothetical protein
VEIVRVNVSCEFVLDHKYIDRGSGRRYSTTSAITSGQGNKSLGKTFRAEP